MSDHLRETLITAWKELAKAHKGIRRLVRKRKSLEQKLASAQAELRDYQEALEDKRLLTRDIAVLIDGENAAPHPALCDVFKMVELLVADNESLRGVQSTNTGAGEVTDNPKAQTLLAAAEMAYPEFPPGTKNGWIYDNSGFAYRWADKKLPNGEFIVRFNPHTNPADAWALEGALMGERGGVWVFGYDWEHGEYFATRFTQPGGNCVSKDRPTLLLKCVDVLRGGG